MTTSPASSPTTRLLVTGVRGKTGVPLARLLLARTDVEVRGGSSDPATVTADPDLAGVRPTAFSWDEPAGWPAAVEGVDAVYLVRPDRADAPALVAALLATLAPATHVVLLSERDPEQVGADGWSVRVERVVRESGRSWTLLRPSWFLQVLTDARFHLDEVRAGALTFPAAGAAIAWIDARDIAAVAEQALLDDAHHGATYELTGPEALDLPTLATLLGEATGHPVEHREVGIEQAVAALDGFERELTELTYERVRDGVFAPVTDAVERVTGRPARTAREFAREAAPRLRRV